jgi:hypothetical protein
MARTEWDAMELGGQNRSASGVTEGPDTDFTAVADSAEAELSAQFGGRWAVVPDES